MSALNTELSHTTSRRRRLADQTLIRETLNSRLVGDVGCGIQFKDVDGVIVLLGEVSSFYLKQVAQECIRNLPCVDQIDNRLTVSRSTTQAALQR